MRLIDADVLRERIEKNVAESNMPNMWYKGIEYAINHIINAPTVDAVPVRHGHWILEREPNGKPYCFHCSVCDDDFHHIGIKSATDYCPNCGARMGEGEEK